MAHVEGVVTAPRMAVVTPSVANLLLRVLSQAGWGPGEWRAHAAQQRARGRRDLADEIEVSYRQLHAAAGEWLAAREPAPVGMVLVASGPDADLASFPEERGEAKTAAVEAASAHEVTTAEAARMLGVSPQRVGQLLKSGGLAGRRQGRSWLVDCGSVKDLLETRRTA